MKKEEFGGLIVLIGLILAIIGFFLSTTVIDNPENLVKIYYTGLSFGAGIALIIIGIIINKYLICLK